MDCFHGNTIDKMIFPNHGIARVFYIGGNGSGSHSGLKKVLMKDDRIPQAAKEEVIKCAETMVILSCKYKEINVGSFADTEYNNDIKGFHSIDDGNHYKCLLPVRTGENEI